MRKRSELDKTIKHRSGVEIRHYREGDEERLNELFQLVFHAERPLEGWYWKFRDNPFLDRILISLAETEEGRIVGMYPLLIMEFKVKNGIALAVQLVEISIHPDFRGRWVITELKTFLQPRTIRSGVNFGFGFPTKSHAKVGLRYMNYKLLGELPIMGLRVNWGSRVGIPSIRKVFGRVLSFVGYFYYTLRFTVWAWGDAEGTRVVELYDFDEDFDRLWETVSRRYSVVARRSSRYLQWRYKENPMAVFTLLGARRDGILAGYVVYTTLVENGEKNGIVFDFFCEGDERTGKPLLRTVLLRLLRERVKTIRFGALPHTDIYGYLEELGFRKWASSPLVNFEVLDERLDGETMSDLSQWYLCIGDTDLLGW